VPISLAPVRPQVRREGRANDSGRRSTQSSEIWNGVPNADMIQYISRKIKRPFELCCFRYERGAWLQKRGSGRGGHRGGGLAEQGGILWGKVWDALLFSVPGHSLQECLL
jgi:hypothetical protein